MKEAVVHFRNEIVIGPGGKQILVEDSAGNPIELFEPAGMRGSKLRLATSQGLTK